MAVGNSGLLLQKMRATSELLGMRLSLAPFDIRADGDVGGVFTNLAWVPSGIAGDVTASARIVPSLGIGLRAFAPESEDGARVFSLAADDLAIASKIVTDDIRAALAPVTPDTEIVITDSDVSMRRSAGRAFEPEELASELRALAAAALLIGRNREGLPPLPVLAATAERTDAFARSRGLRSTAQPPAAFGARSYGYLHCSLERIARGRYALAGRISISDESLRSLTLVPTHAVGILSRAWAGLTGADVQVGNSAFDDEFVIKADDANRARSALSANVQRSILAAVRAFGDLTMRSGFVTIGPVDADVAKPDQLAELASALEAIGESLAAR